MKNIFVGNLSFGATEATVRPLFEAYGTVDRVSIVTDRDTGQARGFGFVEMSVDAEADRAIALYFGLRKQAIDEAQALDHSTTVSASCGTPVLGNKNKKGSTATSMTAISQKQSL